MAHTNYRKLPLWKRPTPSVFMIPNYSGEKLLDRKFFLSIFFFILLLQACAPSRYLNPPADPYNLGSIPYTTTYRTERFFFQPPPSQHWNLLTYIKPSRFREGKKAPIKENKITIYNHQARAWISVAYLKLVEGKQFENQKDLILAFVAGEKEYLAGNLEAPITKIRLHQGFKGIYNPAAPKTVKFSNNYFKVLKWYSMNVDDKKRFLLDIYLTPANDLSGVFVIAMVSPEIPSATGMNLREDLEKVVSSFEAHPVLAYLGDIRKGMRQEGEVSS